MFKVKKLVSGKIKCHIMKTIFLPLYNTTHNIGLGVKEET